MEFLRSLNPLYSLSGLAVGALVGFTGVGGGSSMAPPFGIRPATAIGSQLASHVPDRVLRPVLAGTLAVVGARLAI